MGCGPARAAPLVESSTTIVPSSLVQLPPPASSRGKRYYAFTLDCHLRGEPAFVAAGQAVALGFLGGNWFNRGKAPKGFDDLESAINFVTDTAPQEQAPVRLV